MNASGNSELGGPFRLADASWPALGERLRRLGALAESEEVIDITTPGDGNMNVVRRIATPRRTLVLKQSLPWVARYPQFAAPQDRALRERDFYRLIAREPELARQMPRLLAVDASAFLLVFEDLGPAADLTDHYQGHPLPLGEVLTLVRFLTALHGRFRTTPVEERIRNREMRALNAPHLFEIPLQAGNGLDLDLRERGLAGLAQPLKSHPTLAEVVRELGHVYYRSDGDALLHGDFFLGSILTTPEGLRIIDAEFCFFGPAEFDVGVFLAQLVMARQPENVIKAVLSDYRPGPGWRPQLAAQFAGVEIIRRLLGYAQLPLPAGLEFKAGLLLRARDLVLTGNLDLLVGRHPVL